MKSKKAEVRKEMDEIMAGFREASQARKKMTTAQFLQRAKELGAADIASEVMQAKEEEGEDVELEESETGLDVEEAISQGLDVMRKGGPEDFFAWLDGITDKETKIALEESDEFQDDLAEALSEYVKTLEQEDDLNSVTALLDVVYDKWAEIIEESLQQSEDPKVQQAYINIARAQLQYDGPDDFFAFFIERDIDPETKAIFDDAKDIYLKSVKGGVEKVKANKAYNAGWNQAGGRRVSKRKSSKRRKRISRRSRRSRRRSSKRRSSKRRSSKRRSSKRRSSKHRSSKRRSSKRRSSKRRSSKRRSSKRRSIKRRSIKRRSSKRRSSKRRSSKRRSIKRRSSKRRSSKRRSSKRRSSKRRSSKRRSSKNRKLSRRRSSRRVSKRLSRRRKSPKK